MSPSEVTGKITIEIFSAVLFLTSQAQYISLYVFMDILGPLLDSKLHESRDNVCLGHHCNLRPSSVLGILRAFKKGREEGREGEKEG